MVDLTKIVSPVQALQGVAQQMGFQVDAPSFAAAEAHVSAPVQWTPPVAPADPMANVTRVELTDEARAVQEAQQQAAQQAAQAEADKATRKRLQEQARALKEQRANAWSVWQEQCRQRRDWIEGKKAAWKKAVADRDEQVKQWNAYVEQLRKDYQDARDTQVPPNPDETAPA